MGLCSNPSAMRSSFLFLAFILFSVLCISAREFVGETNNYDSIGSIKDLGQRSKDDGSPVSIFSLSGSNANDGLLAAGRNGVKRLCTIEWSSC